MIMYSKDNEKEYNMGYLYQGENKLSFRYHKMNRTDITSTEVLKNVMFNETSVVINTRSILKFEAEDKVEIKGRKFKIEAIYTDEIDGYDGPVRENFTVRKYLILRG